MSTGNAVAVVPQLVLDGRLDEDVTERAHVENGVDALAAGDVGSVERAHPALQQPHVACCGIAHTPHKTSCLAHCFCCWGGARGHTGEEADAVVALVPDHVEVEVARAELDHVLLRTGKRMGGVVWCEPSLWRVCVFFVVCAYRVDGRKHDFVFAGRIEEAGLDHHGVGHLEQITLIGLPLKNNVSRVSCVVTHNLHCHSLN